MPSNIKSILLTFFSLFSVVRGYNVLVLVTAQYLASIFIFSPDKSLSQILFDLHLHYLILATICVVSVFHSKWFRIFVWIIGVMASSGVFCGVYHGDLVVFT